MTARPETLEAALAALDRVSADRDRLLQKLDAEPDSKKLAGELISMIGTYYNAANSGDQRVLILNLGQLLRQSGALIDALTTELKHCADAECAARDERDALQERVAGLSDEVADLRVRECARSVSL